MNVQVTDLTYLQKLAKGNEDFMRDMIGIFLTENPGEISGLEKAIAESDFNAIAAAAHKLRSTVPFVGIDKLITPDIASVESLAQEVSRNHAVDPGSEHQVQGKALETIRTHFSRIKEVCAKAVTELSRYAK